MGAMTKVSAAVLVAAVVVYLVARTPQAESPTETTVESQTADGDVADVSAVEDPDMEAVRQRMVAEEPPVGVAAVAGTNVLRVILEGITEENARMATVTLTAVDKHEERIAEIRDSWPCQGLTSEFDLDPFFAVVAERHENLRVDELEVEVNHPLHLLKTTRVPLSRGVERKSSQTVYKVRVRLVPAGVIHGRLARADGASAAEGLVGALLLEGGFPREAIAGAVECAADSAFELRLGASGLYALASFEEGRRPTTTRVEVLVGTRVDVGTIVLESGHAITGRVLRLGNPVAGASVSATPPKWKTATDPDDVKSGMNASIYEGRTFTTPARSVHLLWLAPTTTFSTPSGSGSRRGGRFELSGQRVEVDENGAFAFGGLAPGEYLLREERLAEAHESLPGYWDDAGGFRSDKPALAVRAPEHGVLLEFRWTLIRFELAGDLKSEDKGRLLLRSKTNLTPVDQPDKDLSQVVDRGAKGSNVIFEFQNAEFHLDGDEPTYALQAPPNKHMTGEIAFPGRQPVPLDFWTPDPGGEVVVPIRLVRGEEAATLVIELENPQAEIPPEVFTIMLWRADQDGYPPGPAAGRVCGGSAASGGHPPREVPRSRARWRRPRLSSRTLPRRRVRPRAPSWPGGHAVHRAAAGRGAARHAARRGRRAAARPVRVLRPLGKGGISRVGRARVDKQLANTPARDPRVAQ